MDNEQCKDCIHRDVCAYKDHYEDVVKLYEKASEEASKYPWFTFSIYCIKYNVEKPYSVRNANTERRE